MCNADRHCYKRYDRLTTEFGLIRTATGKMVLYYMVGTPIMRYVPDEVLPSFCFNMKLLKDTRSFATKLILPSLSKEMTIFENGKDAAKNSEELDSGLSESPRIPTDVLIAARKLNHSTIILNVTPQEPKSFSLRNSVTYILKFIPPIPLSYLVKYTKDVMKYTRILPTPAKYAKAIPSTHVKVSMSNQRHIFGSLSLPSSPY
jgi:hypothetical protein